MSPAEQAAQGALERIRTLEAALEKIMRHCEVAATHSAIYAVAEKALGAARAQDAAAIEQTRRDTVEELGRLGFISDAYLDDARKAMSARYLP